MKQLGVLDSAFINLEQPNTPQHVGGIGIYDPSTAPDGFVRFKQVIANFEQRLSRMPLFRTRLIEVPGDIDKPYWVLDENFDVEFHLRHIALPHPGDWRQLCIQVARLHARPLDMTRPLWEAYIIEGLDNVPNLPKGSFAVYTKMHHALVDGAGGQSFMAALHDLEPNPPVNAGPVKEEALLVDRDPSSTELLTRAVLNNAKGSVSLIKGAMSVGKDLVKMGLDIAREEIPAPDVQAPKTRFNNPVGRHRVYDATEFSLDDFKAIKDKLGVKVNDVALCVVSGALRKYLDNLGELPEDVSLAASIPMNMRTRREATEDNNQVGSTFTELHTHIADPVERVKFIHQSMMEAKEFSENSPMVDALKLAGVFNPWLSKSLARLYSENQLSERMPMNTSTVITNVAGPNFDMYCAGARLVRYYGMGVLTPGCGMFHTVFSSSGVVTLSILADREALPDPAFYKECLDASFKELKEAALGSSAAKSELAAVSVPADVSSKPAKKKVALKPSRKKTTAKKAANKPASRKKAAAKTPAKKKAAKKASTAKPAKAKAGSKAKARAQANAQGTGAKAKPAKRKASKAAVTKAKAAVLKRAPNPSAKQSAESEGGNVLH